MIYKLTQAKEKRVFYYRIIATFLIISLVPVLFISTLSYYYMEKTLKDGVIQANVAGLHQTVNTMEIIMQQINNGFKQQTSDFDFNKFVNFPNGQYYEDIQGEFGQEDLLMLSRYLENKERAFHRINILKRCNEFVTSVYFLDNKKGIVLTDGGFQYSIDDFYDKDWYKQVDDTIKTPIFIGARSFKYFHGIRESILTVIYKSYAFGLSNDYMIVVNLDMGKIYKEVISAIGSKLDNAFYIRTIAGEEIFGEPITLTDSQYLITEDNIQGRGYKG